MTRRSQGHKRYVQGYDSSGLRPPWLQMQIGAWVAGVDTVTPVVVTGGNARCERLGTTNPRIYKQVSGLAAGVVYRVDSVHTLGTAGLIGYCRASTTSALTNDLAEQQMTTTGAYTLTFTAPANGIVYVGVALGSTINGQYCLTKDQFTVTRIS